MGRETGLPTSSSLFSSSVTGGAGTGPADAEFQRAYGRQRHRHAGLHVQHARAEKSATCLAPRHRPQRSQRPHRIQVPQQQDGLAAAARGAEPDLQHISEVLLFVQFDASSAGFGEIRRQRRTAASTAALSSLGDSTSTSLRSVGPHPVRLGFGRIQQCLRVDLHHLSSNVISHRMVVRSGPRSRKNGSSKGRRAMC
jgi:hypothetical protein